MNKKAFLGILVVVVTLVVATAGCTFSTNPSSSSASPSASSPSASVVPQTIAGYSTYTNATAGVRLQYPSGWTVKEGGSSTRVVQMLADSGSNVIVNKGRQSGSLESARDAIISTMLNTTSYNYTLVSTEKTTLAGMPAYNVTFAAKYFGQDIKQVYSLAMRDGYYYSFIFSSSPEDWNQDQPVFSNIFNSFAITS